MTDRLLDFIRWLRDLILRWFPTGNEKLPYYLTILIAGVVFTIAINGFIELTEELAEDDLTQFDERVGTAIVSFRSETATRYLTFVTHLGDTYAYAAISIVLAAWFFIRHRSWRFTAKAVGVLLLAALSNVVLKEIIHRERPSLDHLVTVTTLSYPSGHAMSAMAFYGFLIFLCLRHSMSRGLQYFLITLLTILIFLIGVSRIYLGVHYASDVLAGWIGGLMALTFCILVFDVTALLRKRDGNGNGQSRKPGSV